MDQRTATTPKGVDARIGERIRNRRKQIGLSQKKLADQLDIVFQQLQKHESGASRVPASRLYEIAQILNVPITFFFEDDEHPGQRPKFEIDEMFARIARDKGSIADQVLDLVQGFIAIKDDEARASVLSLVSILSKSKIKR